MTSFLSADFEKDFLSTSDQVRVIVRNRDDGVVPPSPSATYFPTEPDALRGFIVVEYVSDVIGERFVRVATTTDFSTLTARPLDTFEDLGTDFVIGGVATGDLIEITLADPQLWTSAEYPGTSPFTFVVSSVISATQITTSTPLPAFAAGLNWSIPSRSITGTAGVTRRQGSPAGPAELLDTRFNNLFSSAILAENFVAATKASMTILASNDAAANLVDESFTATSTL